MTVRIPDIEYPAYKATFRNPITDKTERCSLIYNPILKQLIINPINSTFSPMCYEDITSEDYDAIVAEAKSFGDDVTILMFG